METLDELVHLARGGKRGLIEHIQALLSSLGLRTFRKVPLESRGLHTRFSQLVCRARCRRESFDLVPLRFGTFTDDGEGRRLTCPSDTIQTHDLLATQEYLIDRLAL